MATERRDETAYRIAVIKWVEIGELLSFRRYITGCQGKAAEEKNLYRRIASDGMVEPEQEGVSRAIC